MTTEEDYARVAAISANDDEAIGRIVGRALHTVGDDGVVTVEDSPLHGTGVAFVEDFEFDNGYVSPYLVTDPGRMEAVLSDPYILFSAEKISNVQTLMPVLERVMRNPAPLVIVAEKVEGTALQMLVHNHVNGIFQAVAIQAPGFGEKRIHLLEDMAALCGGMVHSKSSSFALEQITVEHLGRASQVRVKSERTTIIGGGGRASGWSGGWSRCAPSSTAPRSAPTRTSSPSGSPGSPARPRSSRSARRPTRRPRRSGTASTTRCRPPGPRSPRASWPAAARR